MNKEKNKRLCYYACIFVFCFLLCYLFPYTHDDWAWGSTYGIERLQNYFRGYNGRWAGNLVVLALTRSNLLKTTIMSFSLTFLLFCINELAQKGKKVFFLPILLLFATPYLIFRQAIVWTAGFSNYVVSLVFVFLFILMNKELINGKTKDTMTRRIIFVVIGFISALFVEHVTVYVLIIGLFSIIYSFIKNKKINWCLVSYFLGALIGTILMFSNSAYGNISNGSDTYRSIGITSFITSSFTSYFDTIYKLFIADNYVLNIVLSGCILANLYFYLKKEKKYIKKIYVLSFIIICFPIYNLLLKVSGINIFLKYTKYINGLFSLVYYASILISAFFIKDKERRTKIIFALVSILILTSPLFVVTPIGGRCFFPMYIFWIWITVEFYLNIVKKETSYLKLLLLSGISLFFIFLICIYGYIFKIDHQRIKYIQNHKNDNEIVLPKLPYSKYIWNPEPVSEGFEKDFKLFYGIDFKTQLDFKPYKEWKKLKN